MGIPLKFTLYDLRKFTHFNWLNSIRFLNDLQKKFDNSTWIENFSSKFKQLNKRSKSEMKTFKLSQNHLLEQERSARIKWQFDRENKTPE